MYKILVADDEGIVTDAVKFILDKTYGDHCEVEIAKNGRQAIHLAETFRPDILTIDIQMPGINGLDALREIHTTNPNVRAIILTAYSNFDYAKEAIHLGAIEYMTKPLNRTQFTQRIDALMHEIDAERAKRESDLEMRERIETISPIVENGFVLSLIYQKNQSSDLDQYRRLLNIPEENGLILVLGIGTWNEADQTTEGMDDAVRIHDSIARIREEIRVCFRAFVSDFIGSQIICALPSDKSSLSYEERVRLIEKARALHHSLEDAFQTGFRVGIGTIHPWSECSRSYEEALNAIRHGRRSVTQIEDLNAPVNHSDSQRESMEQVVLDAVSSGIEAKALQEAGAYASWLAHQSKDLTKTKVDLLELYLLAVRHIRSMDSEKINETDDIRSIINATDEKALREAFRTSMSNLSRCVVIQRDPETGIIDQARKWMQEHFQENIQLDDAARSVGISPYYFSKLFKEQAGVNFIDYLTDLRMEKARDLLAHQNLSIKEVCVRCGYADQNYFSRIFKKTVGMTPTEYRNSK